MRVSEELKLYVLHLIEKGISVGDTNGENALFYSNAILTAAKAYSIFLSIEQALAVNMTVTGQKIEVNDGGKKPVTEN